MSESEEEPPKVRGRVKTNEELKELRTIKKLLILLLMKNKASQDEIAKVLGVDQSAISHMINPKGRPQQKGEAPEEGQEH
jgi:predicted XRE-type DNA-binding protein